MARHCLRPQHLAARRCKMLLRTPTGRTPHGTPLPAATAPSGPPTLNAPTEGQHLPRSLPLCLPPAASGLPAWGIPAPLPRPVGFGLRSKREANRGRPESWLSGGPIGFPVPGRLCPGANGACRQGRGGNAHHLDGRACAMGSRGLWPLAGVWGPGPPRPQRPTPSAPHTLSAPHRSLGQRHRLKAPCRRAHRRWRPRRPGGLSLCAGYACPGSGAAPPGFGPGRLPLGQSRPPAR